MKKNKIRVEAGQWINIHNDAVGVRSVLVVKEYISAVQIYDPNESTTPIQTVNTDKIVSSGPRLVIPRF